MNKTHKRGAAKPAAANGKQHVFRLFVAGSETNSAQAEVNLARLCEEYLKGRYRIETVDVLKDATAAHEHGVLVTPTLLQVQPRPRVTVIGNLSETRQVIAALRLNGNGR